MPDFLRIEDENPKLKQSKIANHLSCSFSAVQRYRNDTNMLSPYKIQPDSTNKRTKKASKTNFNNNHDLKHDLKRPQKTSIDLKRPQLTSNSSLEVKPIESKNKWKMVQMLKLTIKILMKFSIKKNYKWI